MLHLRDIGQRMFWTAARRTLLAAIAIVLTMEALQANEDPLRDCTSFYEGSGDEFIANAKAHPMFCLDYVYTVELSTDGSGSTGADEYFQSYKATTELNGTGILFAFKKDMKDGVLTDKSLGFLISHANILEFRHLNVDINFLCLETDRAKYITENDLKKENVYLTDFPPISVNNWEEIEINWYFFSFYLNDKLEEEFMNSEEFDGCSLPQLDYCVEEPQKLFKDVTSMDRINLLINGRPQTFQWGAKCTENPNHGDFKQTTTIKMTFSPVAGSGILR